MFKNYFFVMSFFSLFCNAAETISETSTQQQSPETTHESVQVTPTPEPITRKPINEYLGLVEYLNSMQPVAGYYQNGKLARWAAISAIMRGGLPCVTTFSNPVTMGTEPHNFFVHHINRLHPTYFFQNHAGVYSLLTPVNTGLIDSNTSQYHPAGPVEQGYSKMTFTTRAASTSFFRELRFTHTITHFSGNSGVPEGKQLQENGPRTAQDYGRFCLLGAAVLFQLSQLF